MIKCLLLFVEGGAQQKMSHSKYVLIKILGGVCCWQRDLCHSLSLTALVTRRLCQGALLLLITALL